MQLLSNRFKYMLKPWVSFIIEVKIWVVTEYINEYFFAVFFLLHSHSFTMSLVCIFKVSKSSDSWQMTFMSLSLNESFFKNRLNQSDRSFTGKLNISVKSSGTASYFSDIFFLNVFFRLCVLTMKNYLLFVNSKCNIKKHDRWQWITTNDN